MEAEERNEVHRASIDDGRTILCSDGGSPYDNLLHLDLLDPDGRTLDRIEAGALMADGIFELHAARRDGFDFSFFLNGETYRLACAPAPRWRSPFLLPYGFRYGTRLARHYLTVRTLKNGM